MATPSLDAWRTFRGSGWRETVDTGGFLHDNVLPYEGGAEFLSGPTARTGRLWKHLQRMLADERRRGIYDVDAHTPSGITTHEPGYLDRDHELIVGLQTSAPLRRAIMPNGGLRAVQDGLAAYGYSLDSRVQTIFTRYRKTVEDGVSDAYPADVLAARRAHLLTGLPDGYGRGRIIGDYRRVALYGVDRLIAQRHAARAALDAKSSSEEVVRDREELAEQIRALRELRSMAGRYGFDISGPAADGQQAIQWLYFAYLAAAKEQNGVAMPLGRTSSFVDVYLQRDLDEGTLTEPEAQELVDDFVIKLRIIRFLRAPGYDRFGGEPTWVTESIGGLGVDGRPLVTRTSFRYLQTLYNLGPAPEPTLTVLWSPRLPEGFKRFCAQVSLDTSAVRYANDELLRTVHDDDAAICCEASAVRVGKDTQFAGARADLAKALLYALNGGRDELTGDQVAPATAPITDDVLDYDTVFAAYDRMLDWLAETYVEGLNVIHYMHDRYAYERLEMALHDYPVHRYLAAGVSGLPVATDSLCAIRYAQVKALRNQDGLIADYTVDGDFPTFGGDDDRADSIAADLVERFTAKIRRQPAYRGAEPTLVLAIASNGVYGKHTGNTPDGRRSGEPSGPGANPMSQRERRGLAAAAQSVAKLPGRSTRDGISLTATVTPDDLGPAREEQIAGLVGVLDRCADGSGFHLDVDVRQRDVTSRTFHGSL